MEVNELLKENEYRSKEINEWLNFYESIKSPLIVISFILSLIFTAAAILLPENHIVRAILTLLVAIFSGIVGALFINRWEKLVKQNTLYLKE